MGLQVWLPLINDLSNQGLTNVVATNNGATLNTSGKIGGCYSFNGTNNYLSMPYNFYNNKYSVCAWVYTNSSTATQTIVCDRTSVGSGFSTFLIDGKLRVDCGGNNLQWKTSYSYPINTWFHVAITYDGGVVRYYINGEFKESKTQAIASTYWGNVTSVGASQANGSGYGNYLNGMLNDFRIYDNCLSPREIKEISKGLVLHYPLSMPGGENLLKNSLTNFPQLWDGSGDGRTLTTQSGVSVPEWGCNDGLRVYGKSGASNALCLLINNSTHGLTVPGISVSGQKYTPSIYIKNNHQNAIYIAFNGLGTGQTINQGEIKKVILNATGNGASYLQFTISASGANKEYDFTFWHPKIELGEVCTPWVPATTDSLYSAMGFNDGIEYDVSGYGNNGTRVGTFSWSCDTPRYSTSTVFSGNQYIVEPNEIITTDSTIALWVKSSLSGNAHVLDARNNSETGKQPIYQYTNGAIQTGGNAAYVISDSGLLVANTWVHVVLVQNGNSLLIYKNGDLFQTISCANSPVIKPTLGARLNFANKYIGQLSDFRIYATALSAADILELYHTPISLSNNGTLLTQGEYVES